MALHGSVQVNGRVIGWWAAVREGGTDNDLKPDDVVHYTCEVHQDKTQEGVESVHWQGKVEHRFGDGALKLASLVLAEAVK